MPARVTHGDYRLGNLLFVQSRLTAIIDWELWALGDPRTDLAWLVMFCDPAIERRAPGEAASPGSLPSAADVVSAYEDVRPGTPLELGWFTAYAHYKLASTMSVLAKRNRRASEPDPTLERAAQTLPAAIERGLEETRRRTLNTFPVHTTGFVFRVAIRPAAASGPGRANRGERTAPRYTGDDSRAIPSARSPNPGAITAPGCAISSSATSASVVSISAATEAACWIVSRVTRSGSMTPSSNRSPKDPVKALSPCPSGIARTWSITA